MILVIDNYDSFVHNLARYVREAGHETLIIRNDEVSASECMAMSADAIILSPGPGRPSNALLCAELLDVIDPSLPVLGVCLGHQCLVEFCGGRTKRAKHPLHGEASEILHEEGGIFQDISSPMSVGRYHSLVSSLADENKELRVTAWSSEGEVMAVEHVERPWFGVQFHPESLLSRIGRKVIENFVYKYVGS
ncbi:anthranilate synthase component II [Hyphococcus lacteus]|uniref:Aminodeoxychorismate/anthranilate synthase component II n=1 Tax=Hyphococcus lacteus TaxID=3143536 RepID=A0ABV3Z517_9PROT